MSKQIFLPESLYGLDSTMNHEKLSVFYENSSSITGKVLRLDSKNRVLEVDLGGGLCGIMNFSDATIYPIYKLDGSLSPNIYGLVGKTIQAKIVNFMDNNIFLSRKANMLEALEVIKGETEIKFASVIGFSKLSAFMDIGAGIMGRSYGKYFSPVKFKDIQKDTGINTDDIISVKIVEFIEDTNKFELSRVEALPSIHDTLNESDVVICKVFEPVNDVSGIGYFVSINNMFSGIVDSYEKLEYGDEILALISKITDAGLVRLDLVKKL